MELRRSYMRLEVVCVDFKALSFQKVIGIRTSLAGGSCLASTMPAKKQWLLKKLRAANATLKPTKSLGFRP
jgi:hypothetical protein